MVVSQKSLEYRLWVLDEVLPQVEESVYLKIASASAVMLARYLREALTGLMR